MSLLDAFKPKWQNSNPDKRIEAVSELGLQNQDTLERIALTDEDANVRTSAIKKLNVTATLQRIAKNDNDASVRRLAETRYYEEISKKLKDFNEPATAEILQFIDEIKDSRFADDLMKNMKSSELRQALVSKCTKISLLTLAANRDSKEQIAKAAVEQITSEQALQDIAKNSKHTSVRKIAADKLRASKEAKDNGKKAEELLASKREALIKQAHFFAAQKDTTDTRPKFEALMDEAKTLGMGQSQAELDDIYNSFIKFVNEADAARLQAIKAEEDKKANIERLYISLDELDSIIKNNLVDEKSARVTEILTDCASFKSIMDANLLKRYSLVSLRIDEAKKSTEIAEQAAKEDSEISGNRTTLLEQLQALADTDADDMTEKHLRSIVREWEKLPLLEGADPVLQSYNALRNKLSEKITSYSEASQKTIEENSKKLRVLIEKINAIDENQDFKEIHKVLRETYQEWKNIVGEQKFKYHDLWQEYKNATARFQEMQQWESWHNEKDRDTILEEMEALSREAASQAVLAKLRELSNKWRDIGPISPAKLTEYREKFQTLFDKVKENCAPFIEEQQAERQKNLADKEALCQKAEELVASTEIFWKDKFKTMQEIQESWKNIGMVPKESMTTLFDRFKAVTNAFYAQHKENLKQEDQTREANYEKKAALCIEAEALKESSDWNATSNKLKQLQESWKAIGPVPKSKSDEIWQRFRTACDSFFEKKRAHFEEQDASKQKNLEAKQALCEKLEALDMNNITDEIIGTVKSIEAEWKTIGMVPKESVESISDRFSETINQFLSRCAEKDENLSKQLNEIKAKKQDMIEKVKQFAESAGSNQLADAVREIQKEWRELGSCGIDDLLIHKAFREACDDFFTRRRDQLDIQEQARQNNLQKKILLCEQAEDLLTDLSEATVGGSMNKVKHLRHLWKEVGAVPRDQSDKIWKRFNAACDQVFAFGRKDEPKPTEAAATADSAVTA